MRRPAFLMLLAAAFLALGAAPVLADDGTIVSRIPNPKIREASGLAVSATTPDLGYTINDSKNQPIVYAIQVSTGKTVGRIDLGNYLSEKKLDTESLYVDPRGQMWVGDLGDNDHSRKDASILVFPEPGPGDHTITNAQRIGVKYDDGNANVEAMLVNPVSGQVFLASKNTEGGPGTVYRLTTLQPGVRNLAVNLHVKTPTNVSDGSFSDDGSLVLLRTYSSVWIVDPRDWNMLRQMPLPKPNKSESITFERGDQSFLVGGEGEDSAIIRDALPLNPVEDKVKQGINENTGEVNSAPWGLPVDSEKQAAGVSPKAIAGLGIGIVAMLSMAAVVAWRRW